MEKNIIQDIKPASNNSSNKGPNPFGKRKNPAMNLPKEVPFVPTPPKGSSKHGLWIIAVICIVALVGSLSFLFENATVTVVPKTIPVAFDATDTFTATKDSQDENTLSYMIMSLSGDVSISLPSTETKVVDNFAKGKVTLFNNYSSTAYKISKYTQIKGANGQIYKIDDQVSIPGYRISVNGNIPGSVDVGVTAATSGEMGNIDNTDFTIPYFAKRPQAGKIYVRIKSPITGGFSGVIHTIPQASADAAYQSLKDKLRASLVSKTKVQVPDGYLFYDGATIFDTDDSVIIPYSKNDQIPLGLHGKLTAYLIKKNNLIKNIATKFINGYNNEPVSIPKISSLNFILPTDKTLDPINDTTLTFNFDGSASILWAVDQDSIKNVLVGKPKSSLETMLSGMLSVDKADVVIKPFWKQSFPDDIKKINVIVTNPLN